MYFFVSCVQFIVGRFAHSWFRHEIDIFRSSDEGICVRFDLVAGRPFAGIKVSRALPCLSSHVYVFVVQKTENSNLYCSMPINWYRTKRLRNLFDKPPTAINVGTIFDQLLVATECWTWENGRPSFWRKRQIFLEFATFQDRLYAVCTHERSKDTRCYKVSNVCSDWEN